MTLAHPIRFGARLLIGFNLLMALGSIWIFMRMTPAIEIIIDRNVLSLEACEEMLAALSLAAGGTNEKEMLEARFSAALKRAQNNITEKEEPIALRTITKNCTAAFLGNTAARKNTVAAITLLGKINRQAMISEDRRAQQIGTAGAWGVVFMAVSVFLAGMLFIRELSKNVLHPLEELQSVIAAHLSGDAMRRFSCVGLPKDVGSIFNGFNELLDQSQPRFTQTHTDV